MIDLGRPAMHAEGLTIFADHAEAGRFHYLPDVPRLRHDIDGKADIRLVKYRLDPSLTAQLGGGLLTFSVELGADETAVGRARGRLAAREGLSTISLDPVAVEGGTVGVVIADYSTLSDAPVTSPFVLRVSGGETPSLFGGKAASFAVVLTPEGANLVEQALLAGAPLVSAFYALTVSGLRPALRAGIRARWDQVYSFYENRLHGGKLLLATDIGPTVEELVRAEAISIHIDELLPAEEQNAASRAAIEEAQRYVLEELFTPTLGQTPAAPPPDGLAVIGQTIKDVIGFFSITYSLRKVERSELKTFDYQLATAQAQPFTLAPQGRLQVALEELLPPERLIAELDMGPQPEMRFDIGVGCDLAAEDIDHVEVVVSYGDRREEIVLDAASPSRELSIWYVAELGIEIDYRYTVAFRPSTGDVDVLAAEARTTDDRIIRIDPRELYRRATVRAVAHGVPFETYPRVVIDVQARQTGSGWAADATLELDAQHLESSVRFRTSRDAKTLVRRRIRYLAGDGQIVTNDWDDAELGVLVVGDPLPDVVDVQILGAARFGTHIARLVVEFRPLSNPGKVDTVILSAERPSATWSCPMQPGFPRGYEYRVTTHSTLAEVREGVWLAGAEGKLVVGEGIAQLRQVQLLFVGKALGELGLLGVKVRFSFVDSVAEMTAEDERLVTDLSQPVLWSYPVADRTRQAYTYELTLVHSDGRLEPLAPVSTEDLMVIQPLAAPGGP